MSEAAGASAGADDSFEDEFIAAIQAADVDHLHIDQFKVRFIPKDSTFVIHATGGSETNTDKEDSIDVSSGFYTYRDISTQITALGGIEIQGQVNEQNGVMLRISSNIKQTVLEDLNLVLQYQLNDGS